MEGSGLWSARVAACALALAVGASAQEDAAPQPDVANRVIGRAVDEQGNGLGGVAIATFGTDDGVDTNAILARAETRTRADGTFAIEVDNRHDYMRVVFAIAGRQAMGVGVAPHDEPTRHTDLGEFVLPAGAALIGRVRDTSGEPIEGVCVQVTSALGLTLLVQGHLIAGATSDSDGIFRVPCVPQTGMRVVAYRDGYQGVERIVAQDSPLDLRLQKADMASGTVVDGDGRPVAGCQVNAYAPGWNRHQPTSTLTADDGSFSVPVPPDGARYRVFCYAEPTRRQYRSAILRGAVDGLTLEPGDGAGGMMRELTVRAVDSASKEPIEQFSVATIFTPTDDLQRALFHGGANLRPFTNEAHVAVDGSESSGLLVTAKHHAFAVLPLPKQGDDEVVVELGPEAVITGVVVDAATGEPLADVSVRALPRGETSGSGGSPPAAPRSDAQGRFRIGGLQPGEYGVQAHAHDRIASEPVYATTSLAEAAEVTLTAPARLALRLDVRGELPPGPRPTLRLQPGVWSSGHAAGFFRHSLTPPRPHMLTGPGIQVFEPLASEQVHPELFVPSRTRVGAGTTIPLGDYRCAAKAQPCELPDLGRTIVRGRVRPSQPIPFEYVAVVATRAETGDREAPPLLLNPCMASVRGDGTFTVDLPHGAYGLQLADVRSGVVFHTELDDYHVSEEPLTISPTIRWLEVACVPATGGSLEGISVRIRLPRPRGGAYGAFLRYGQRSNDTETSYLPSSTGAMQDRWLVPTADVELTAQRAYSMLAANPRYRQPEDVDAASITIERAEQRVVLRVPKEPSDAELLRDR